MGVYMCSSGQHIRFISVTPMQFFECDCPPVCEYMDVYDDYLFQCTLPAGHKGQHLGRNTDMSDGDAVED